MNILIVEDSNIIATFIENCIKKHFPEWNIDISLDYDSALNLAITNTYQLMILDYELDIHNPQKNGFLLGKQLKKISKYKDIPVIFETSYQEHIFNVVNELNCIYYLTKPFTEENIIKMINKIKASLSNNIQLTFTDSNQIKFFANINDIVYVSANKHQLTIHTQNSRYICCNYTLSTLEAACNSKLIRCHKSYLVNADYICNIDKRNQIITLSNPGYIANEQIPIGRKYLTSF